MLRRMLIVVATAAVVPAAAALGAEAEPKADQVETLITQALQAHRGGKTAEAVAMLQKAIALMQESLQKGLAAFFPKAPEGWDAGEIESHAMSMGSAKQSGSIIQVSRKYTRKKDKLAVSVALTNAPQLVAAQKAAVQLYQNPRMLAMLNRDPNKQITVINEAGWTGWKMIEKPRSAQAVAIAQGCMLTVQVSAADQAVLETFWKAIDRKGLAAEAAKAAKAAKAADQ